MGLVDEFLQLGELGVADLTVFDEAADEGEAAAAEEALFEFPEHTFAAARFSDGGGVEVGPGGVVAT
jgi:hypothetical protein